MGFNDVSSWDDALLGRERAGNGVVPFQLTEKGDNVSGTLRQKVGAWQWNLMGDWPKPGA